MVTGMDIVSQAINDSFLLVPGRPQDKGIGGRHKPIKQQHDAIAKMKENATT